MKRIGLAIVVLACAGVTPQAGGQPAARDAAAANTLIATLIDISEPDSSRRSLQIRGKVMAPSHRFAPKKCRANRTFDTPEG